MWIKLPCPENPRNTYARYTETLDSWDLSMSFSFLFIKTPYSLARFLCLTFIKVNENIIVVFWLVNASSYNRQTTIYKEIVIFTGKSICCCVLTLDPAQNAIRGDVPEGSDTFQWQLGEEIAWAEIG